MITTFAEIVKNEGFEPLKNYEIDKWFGDLRHQRHVTGIMLMDVDKLCLWYRDYYARSLYKDKMLKFDGVCDIITIDEEYLIWADSEDEMTVDYEYLIDKRNADNNYKINKALDLLKKFAIEYDELDYSCKKDIEKAIKDKENDDFDIIRERLYDWSDHSEDVGEDEQAEISRIYQSHSVGFRNTENEGIWTHVDLTQAVVVYLCKYDNRNCICIETSDGNEYHVFKVENKIEYIALCVLYNYCI